MRRALAAVAAVGMVAVAVLSGTLSSAAPISTSRLRGIVFPAWQWPPKAVTSPTIESETAALHVNTVRISLYDCLSDGTTCGQDRHAGTISATALQQTVQAITSTALNNSVPFVQFLPVTKGAIGALADGSVNCPPSSNWGADLAADKDILAKIAAVYKGQIILQADGNEPEYACAGRWGSGSAGSATTSTDIGKFWSATGPALASYAASLGFSKVVNVGYLGLFGGTSWGNTCSASATAAYGYTCTINTTRINAFNNAVKAAGKSPPDIESVDTYPHSADNATAPGAPNPFTFPDGVVLAELRQFILTWHSRMNAIFGSTVGNTRELANVEWQGGSCTSSSNCWSGYTNGSGEGNFTGPWLNDLKGNGVLTGAGNTGWALAMMFVDAGNAKPASPTTPSGGQYDIIYPDGTKPYWYAGLQSAYAGLP